MIAKEEIISFLIKAKKATYSSGKSPKRYSNGNKVYVFKHKDFQYRDLYFGSLIDSGIEVIYYKNSPIWSMSFRGGMTTSEIDSHICFEFLKKALSNPDNKLPARGPMLYKSDCFVYVNLIQGHIFDFNGTELIFKNEDKIYLKKYIGGIINHHETMFLGSEFNSILL